MIDIDKGKKIGIISSRLAPNRYQSLALLIILSALSLSLWDVPWAQAILSPVRTSVTAVHELGHAIACLATGGSVTGMTIVSDNNGHGGLTFCSGGLPFIYTQTGYLGTALFGSFLIFVGQYPRAAKAILALLGLTICTASLTFMFGTILHGEILQGLGSMLWGALIGAALIWGGVKLQPSAANFILIFLAAQTALNAVTDIIILSKLSIGLIPSASFSDATNMAVITGIPAAFWSILWGIASLSMLSATLWFCYRPKQPKVQYHPLKP